MINSWLLTSNNKDPHYVGHNVMTHHTMSQGVTGMCDSAHSRLNTDS